MQSNQREYDKKVVSEVCNEIEKQWMRHVITRAAFPSGFRPALQKHISPAFFEENGIQFSVKINKLDEALRKPYERIAHWQNQNFIIRLFGILTEYNIDVAGKIEGNDFTYIISTLRHKVGAHSKGFRNPSNSDAKKATALLTEHFGEGIDLEDVLSFNLSITPVLEGLKNKAIEFVQSLEGRLQPNRGQRSWNLD